MVFSSLTFLCVFLPIVFLLYYLIPSIRMQNILLIIASLLFYAYGEPVYIILMLFSVLMNYGYGLVLGRTSINTAWRKGLAATAVCSNLGLLFVFKYLDLVIKTCGQICHRDFAAANLALPIGISFFTFQAMSYVIDVYRGSVSAEKNLFNIMLYITFFPQLIAGPIVKFHDIQLQLHRRKKNLKEIAEGIRRFIIGLAKKVLISNTLALTADILFAEKLTEINILSAWLAAAAYLFQIYFDFSGYSDMAIGLGHMFGFRFQENFKYPYISGSIQEFWRRWHISLSTWFKEYVYIPLGGNRKGKARTYINKWIVFCATGIWHGANWTFLLWGIWHGSWILLEDILRIKKWPGILRHIYTMLIVCIGFVMFRADSVQQGMKMIGKMFGGWTFGGSQMNLFFSQLSPLVLFTFFCAIVCSTPILPWIAKRIKEKTEGNINLEWAGYGCSIILLFLSVLSLSGGTYNPFIYFRF